MVMLLTFSRNFSCKQADMGEQDPGGCTGDCCLEILGETAASAEPGEGSLDALPQPSTGLRRRNLCCFRPSAGQEFKSFRGVGAFYDLYGPFPDFFEAPFQFRPSIAAIGEDMPQGRVFPADGFEHGGCAIAVLNIGGMDNEPDEVPERIGDDMSFASLDLLTRIKPTWPARLGRFHRLAIDHARGGRYRASSPFPRHRNQGLVDACERAVTAEAVEICLYRCKRCELPGDLPPLTASRQHVENRFNNHAQRYRAWPSAGRRCRHKRRDQRPFSIGKVACIAQLITAVLPPSGFSPGHRDSVSCCKPTESQPTEIAQLSFSFRLSDPISVSACRHF